MKYFLTDNNFLHIWIWKYRFNISVQRTRSHPNSLLIQTHPSFFFFCLLTSAGNVVPFVSIGQVRDVETFLLNSK